MMESSQNFLKKKNASYANNFAFKETWNFLFTKIHFKIFQATFQTTECPWDSQSICPFQQMSATDITISSDKIQRQHSQCFNEQN